MRRFFNADSGGSWSVYKRTAVVRYCIYLHKKDRIGRDIERLATHYSLPASGAFHLPIQLAGKDLHDLGGNSGKLILTRLHDAECLFAAIREDDSVAGDLAIEVDVGLFNNRYVAEF